MSNAADAYLRTHEEEHLGRLFDLLRIQSIKTDPAMAGEVHRCAEHVADLLREIGLNNVTLFPTKGHPVVYADWLEAGDAPTALLYGHYDVQPPEPLELWDTPPFEPTVRDGNIYARGSADDKGQIFLQLMAIEAHLKTSGRLPTNVKIIIEGEEEVGSPNLDKFIQDHRDLLKADIGLISDTSMYAPGVPSLDYGLRGLAVLQVEITSAAGDLHSGLFGGAIANPIQVLAQLINDLKDREGRVTIPGFYDDVVPISDDERHALAALPFDETKYLGEIGALAPFGEPGYTTLERIWARPTFEINGIWGGFSGEGSKTVLPNFAAAKISCRLVPNQDPDKITKILSSHLAAIAPASVKIEVIPLLGGKPALTPLDHPALEAAATAIERGFGKRPVFTRSGGSIPVVATLQSELGIPTVLMGFCLPDCNAHAPNERMNLANFYAGSRTAAAFWEELARLG